MATKGMAQRVQVNVELIEKACTSANIYLNNNEERLQNLRRILRSLQSEDGVELGGGQGDLIIAGFRTIEKKMDALDSDMQKIKISINDKLMKSIAAQKDKVGISENNDTMKNIRNVNGIKRN